MSFELGRLDPPSVIRYLRWIRQEFSFFHDKASQHWKSYSRNKNRRSALYNLLNALGYSYGTAIAERLFQPVIQAAESGSDLETVMREAGGAIDMMRMLADDVEPHRQAGSSEVIKRAILDLGPGVPVDVDPEATVAEVLARDPIYFNDFHYNVKFELYSVASQLEEMVALHTLPGRIVYRKVPRNDPAYPGYFAPEGMVQLSDEEMKVLYKSALLAGNKEVAQRTYYGLRTIEIPADPSFTVLGWSNGAARWWVYWGKTQSLFMMRVRGYPKVNLDADEIFVPFHPIVMQAVAAELDPLPLYELSLEAKERGIDMVPTERNVRKVLRMLADQMMPGADREDRAVQAINLFELSKRAQAGDPFAKGIFATLLKTTPGPIIAYIKILEWWIKLGKDWRW